MTSGGAQGPTEEGTAFLSYDCASSALVRTSDWSGTLLGHPRGWPNAVKAALATMMSSPEAMAIAWGKDLTFFYNDAYAPMLGDKVEGAMGKPFADLWYDVWDDISTVVDAALAGRGSSFEDLPLTMRRYGYPESTYWTFSCAPLRDERNDVIGVVVRATETTRNVLARMALKDSELRHRQILDGAVDYAIVATDKDGKVTRWNEGARRILGWTEGEMIGRSVDRFFTPEDREKGRVEEEMRSAAERGGANDERWHVRKDGERFYANGEMTPLLDEADRVVGYVKVLRDFTERRLAEQAFRASEASFRTVAEAMPGFVWTADEDGALEYASPHWLEYSGSTTGEGIGQGWANSVHPDDRRRAGERWMGSVATKEPYEIEFRLRRADGEYRWWLARARAVLDETTGKTRWIGVSTDLQELVEAREVLARGREELEAVVAERTQDLRLSRARLRALSDNSVQLLGLVDMEGIVLDCNQAALSAIGQTRENVVGTHLAESPWFVGTKGMSDLVRSSIALASRGEVQKATMSLDLPSGATRTYEYALRPVTDEDGVVVAMVPEATDVTERMALEEQLRQSQKMEAVGQLTGGIAHDFNNLLTGITGSLDLLQVRVAQGRLDQVDRYVVSAQGAARRAAALTHRLLAFSRRQTLAPKPTDANRLVADMEELVRRTVGPAIEMEVVGAASLWTTLVDPPQLENALLNLCINARDAMPNGGKLTIETSNRWLDDRSAREHGLPQGQYVSVSVTDTGTGMPPEVVERVFEPFFTTKPIGQGTGLGLSMIYGFARQSEGQVRVYSEVGIGTTITLYVPRYLGEAEAHEPAGVTEDGVRASAGETVLVVDDEPTVRMLVAEVLSDLGYTAIEASDGNAGMRVLRSGTRIDLLVTDVGLPGGMNGRQMADAGRTLRPGLKVLFITGYAENAAVNGILEPGMQVLTKPFSIDVLTARIRDIVTSR